MIRVMLVDDQNLVRKGVRSLLELAEEIEVIAEAADGAEARRLGSVLVHFAPDPGLAERLPTLFDEFTRSTQSGAKNGAGSGLGLAVARHTVEQHGGRLSLEPAPGGGTDAQVELPLQPPSEHSGEPAD